MHAACVDVCSGAPRRVARSTCRRAGGVAAPSLPFGGLAFGWSALVLRRFLGEHGNEAPAALHVQPPLIELTHEAACRACGRGARHAAGGGGVAVGGAVVRRGLRARHWPLGLNTGRESRQSWSASSGVYPDLI